MKPDASDDPRVRYAIERTLLAWVRTGLALMGFGFVVARFGLFLHEIEAVHQNAMPKASTGLSLWIGTELILLGVLVNLLVSAEHLRLMRQIQSVPPFYSQWMGCRLPVEGCCIPRSGMYNCNFSRRMTR